MASSDHEQGKAERKRRRKRRWGDAAAESPSTTSVTAPAPAPKGGASPQDAKTKALALQESVRARLAALKAKKASAVPTPTPTATAAAASQQTASVPAKRSAEEAGNGDDSAGKKSKRAKHFDIDWSVTAPTFQKEKPEPTTDAAAAATAAPKKKVNPYLSYASAAAGAEVEEEAVDERLVRASKPRSRHKQMKFVEPGTFVEIAERKRQRAVNAAQSGFTSGRKTGEFVQKSNMAQVYGAGGGSASGGGIEEAVSYKDPALLPPRAEQRYDHMPLVMEWWDMELLPAKLKKAVASQEGKALSKQTQAQLQQLGSSDGVKEEAEDGDKKLPAAGSNDDDDNEEEQLQQLQKKCWEQASLSYSKTADLIQHIVPMKPPHVETQVAKKPVLHLTKKELKRQRKLRRQDKQRELQDRQAAGLVPPPEPRLTLKNFIQVLGDQAYLDPSQMEQKVMEQIQARQRAHLERNQANKLTKEQRAAKKVKKLEKDAQSVTKVALFFVKDMSHPYHRAKVDLNAQQNFITGGVLECENPAMACVICEGGPKAIRRYKRLMLVRMKWTGTDDDDDDEEDEEDGEGEDDDAPKHKFNKENRCELVWEGLAVKRLFQGFVFQSCETAAQARKVLKAKGVEHYWDQVMEYAQGSRQGFQLKLVDSSDSEDSDNGNDEDQNDHGADNAKVEAMDES